MKILKEDVKVSEISYKSLTTDCMFIHLQDGQVDIVRSSSMVEIFDSYHDNGKKVVKIEHSGGCRNPKFQQPSLE